MGSDEKIRLWKELIEVKYPDMDNANLAVDGLEPLLKWPEGERVQNYLYNG
jgi:hypothetical protein